MKRLLRIAVAGIVAAAASGCATTITAGSHVDRRQNFRQYHTYEWGPADALPTGDPRLDKDPFFKDHFEGAVERQLASRGLELIAGGQSDPDLLIHYHAAVNERMDVNRVDRGYGYCRSGGCPSDTVWYEAGTLLIDVVDARSHKLVWRAWAQNDVERMLRDRSAMARIIDRAVMKMFEQYPATH
jgi:hypothetical protein